MYLCAISENCEGDNATRSLDGALNGLYPEDYLYRCTVHFEDSLSIARQQML
jgi:hypothetical protein